MDDDERFRVPPEQLRWVLDPAALGLDSTDDVAAQGLIPGQDRAMRALEIGLRLRSHGYNVFVAGESGSHRSETLNRMFESLEDPDYAPEDFCYVFNFRDPDLPRLLRFQGGRGCSFRSAMEQAVQRLRSGIPRLLTSEVYAKRRKARVKRYTVRMEQLAAPLREKAEPEGLSLVQVQIGDRADAELLPVIGDEPVAFEDLEVLVEKGDFSKAELQRLHRSREGLLTHLRTFSEGADQLASEAGRDLAGLDSEMTRPYLNSVLNGVYTEFSDVEGAADYIREVEEYLEGRLQIFRRVEEDEDGDEDEVREAYRRLSVNLVLDNERAKRRPVIQEPNPTVMNLRGSIDREVLAGGRVVSDFNHIRAGSILRAHGGFLVVHVDDLDSEGTAAWNLLKRTLRTGQLRIETEHGDPAGTRALRPQPIPVDVKVIIIGTSDLYQTLLEADSDFSKLFKIKAEFDTEMELSPQSLTECARIIRAVCDMDKLPPFGSDGVAAVVEFGVRLVEHRNRITTQFTKIEDLVRESAFWAQRREAERIEARDVRTALQERRRRVNLYEERTQRLIREGVLFIDTEGAVTGQINGLTVMDLGNHRFGRPARITASASAGTAGIVNIERQVRLSGSYHDKGLLILTGLLRETFAAHHPLSMSASLTLEQSYSEVDGDSATVAETLALLSALSGIPARQDVAVTGSMNQKGAVQPVGGVNEKTEGFFDLCAARGLSGTQGVVVPRSNLSNLMLRPDVVEAVRQNRYHVYAVETLADAVRIVFGRPAGERKSDGSFTPGSVFERVAQRLAELAQIARDYNMGPPR